MDYQVWVKDQFGDTWGREDVGDLGAAKRSIMAAMKLGNDAVLTIEVPFSLELKVGEPGAEVKKKRTPGQRAADENREGAPVSEADQGEAEPYQDPGS